jgi:flagellar biosynthesis/type III secretory pathway protein FliH
MHARSETAVACGRAALVALLEVPPETRQCYLDLVSACLTEDQMAEAAQQLPPEAEVELSKMELESYSYTRGLRLGREAGVEEGRKAGSRQTLQAACAAILATLHATLAQRGVELDAESRTRVEQCKDFSQLSQWLVRAATANSAADLFG